MFPIRTAVVTALLALAVTSLGAAQNATDSTRRDLKQDNRALARDTVKLHQDIAMRDSVSNALAQDRKQLKAGEARIDSLKAQLAKDRKAHDTAAIKQDEKALNDAREAQERELDRMKREDARLKAVEAKVRKERDAVGDTRSDLKQERSSVRSGDLRQDQRQFARDTVTLDKDKARRDSVQDALARDRTRTKAIEARIDSLRTQLAKDRKASDTAAIKQDEAALDAAQKAHTNALDQQQREVALLKQVDAKTRKQADTTNDVHRDIKHDRSAERAHSTQASSRRR